ncbi:hypothetical protein V462_06470 [Pantoea ananatis 15320]|nr:hypothetical protein V462_06470 [Pantoea ananatis 15320]
MLLLSSGRPMITNVSIWHKADRLTELEVRYERGVDVLKGPFRPLFTNSKEDA